MTKTLKERMIKNGAPSPPCGRTRQLSRSLGSPDSRGSCVSYVLVSGTATVFELLFKNLFVLRLGPALHNNRYTCCIAINSAREDMRLCFPLSWRWSQVCRSSSREKDETCKFFNV